MQDQSVFALKDVSHILLWGYKIIWGVYMGPKLYAYVAW